MMESSAAMASRTSKPFHGVGGAKFTRISKAKSRSLEELRDKLRLYQAATSQASDQDGGSVSSSASTAAAAEDQSSKFNSLTILRSFLKQSSSVELFVDSSAGGNELAGTEEVTVTVDAITKVHHHTDDDEEDIEPELEITKC